MANLPRGLEVLLKKAAVDAGFRERLLQDRARAADLIGLTLEPAEAAMLDAIPASQLAATVAGTTVDPALRPTFMTYAAAAMVGAITTQACVPPVAGGARPDEPNPPYTTAAKTAAADDVQPMRGARADEPSASPGVIEGRVTDDGGEPVAGAKVEVVGTAYATVTDDNGRYRLTGVPAGDYQLNSYTTGYYQLAPADVTVTAGKTVEIDLAVRYVSPPGGARPDLP